MLYSLLSILLQPEVSGGPACSSAGRWRRSPPGPMGCGGGTEQIGFLLLMFAVLYFLMIRPQQKRAKQHDQMLGAFKKGDIVRTNGGIRGEVTALDERDVTIEIADRTRSRSFAATWRAWTKPPKKKAERTGEDHGSRLVFSFGNRRRLVRFGLPRPCGRASTAGCRAPTSSKRPSTIRSTRASTSRGACG